MKQNLFTTEISPNTYLASTVSGALERNHKLILFTEHKHDQ